MGMDPASSPLGKMLVDEISPVVMVLRTASVEESCRKNGLSLIEILNAFSDFSNIDVPVRTSSDQPYRVRRFRLRLFYESEIQQPNITVVKERLKDIVSRSGEEVSDLSFDPPQMSDASSGKKFELLPSWCEHFNREVMKGVSFSEHEAFDHPVACLLAVSSKDYQPINQFVDLFNTNKLPALFNSGAMDPKILKYFLLVHDNHDGSSENTSRILMDMKNTFGSSDCRVLCINSSSGEQRDIQNNPWASHNSVGSTMENVGLYLNNDDQNEIRIMMQELCSKHVIPHMEQKVRMLNLQVSSTRKGFRNQIKNLWWRKGKEDAVDSSNGQTYTFSSIESQIRVLGDYAFILQDYELAISNYRLISTDYKLDKAWKRYAGVQEMIGLTLFMLDQSQKEADYSMDNALSTYSKLVPSGQPNATRCGLWWIEMLKTRDQAKDAATIYLRICNEERLLSAVMLEQASYCFLLSEPPMPNKYGFHLVLSGDNYKRCNQIKHAIRAYRGALSVYKRTTWSYIKDHIHYHIGQWYGSLGMYDVAAEHLLEIVACTHQSRTAQELFLRDFSEIVQKAGRKFENTRLQLPIMNVSSLTVIFEDHRTYASPAAAAVREKLWLSLEEEIIPSLPTAKANWLDLQSKLLPKRYKESNFCVAGEQILVTFEFRNPLQIPLSVSCVSLICEYAAAESIESDVNKLATKDFTHDKIVMSDTCTSPYFNLTEVELSFAAEETLLVQLTVTPIVEGNLKIIGVRWKLSGSVYGFFSFESVIVSERMRKRKGGSKHSLSTKLNFIITKSAPRLEATIDDFPKTTYHGALQHLNLKLENSSESIVKDLKLKINHPRFFIVGSTGDAAQNVFSFPKDVTIEKEKPLVWPIWFRAAYPGTISLCMVLYYEIQDTSSVMKYRTLRMHFTFQVFPSIDFSLNVAPCPSKFDEFLVRMDIVNCTSSCCFQFNQFSCVGKKWQLSLLQPIETVFPSQILDAGQALCCFFKLKRSRDIEENRSSSVSALCESVVKLTLEDDTKNLLDVHGSPLLDFHEREKLHNKQPFQELQNAVEFILTSQLRRNDETTTYISHHACNCTVTSQSPISWVLDAPHRKLHNFHVSFCQIDLSLSIYNASDSVVSVSVTAEDPANDDATGWQPVSNDTKPSTDVAKPRGTESVPPWIWSGCSSTKIDIAPLSFSEVPLQICVFGPGVYDVSSYVLNWTVPASSDEGRCFGYPFFLTVLHSH